MQTVAAVLLAEVVGLAYTADLRWRSQHAEPPKAYRVALAVLLPALAFSFSLVLVDSVTGATQLGAWSAWFVPIASILGMVALVAPPMLEHISTTVGVRPSGLIRVAGLALCGALGLVLGEYGPLRVQSTLVWVVIVTIAALSAIGSLSLWVTRDRG